MYLRKLALLASICTVTLFGTNVYATSVASVHHLSAQEKYQIKDIIISNLDSLFTFQTQITVRNISQDNQGDIIASDILIMSGGTKNPNISINKLTLKGLDVNQRVSGNFDIKISGLSVTNLASSVANSNVMSSELNPKDLASNQGFFSIAMNSLSQGLYDIDLKYDHGDNSLDFKLDSSLGKKRFVAANLELKNVDLSDTLADSDFLASLEESVINSNVKEFEFNANLSKLIENVTSQYMGKKYNQTPILDITGSLGKKKGQFKLDIAGKLGSKSYIKYKSIVDGIDLDDVKTGDIIYSSSKNQALKNAYVQESTADAKLDFNFDYYSFPKESPVRQALNILGQKKLKVTVLSSHEFKNSQYNTDFDFKLGDLASLSANTKAKVDGKLSLLPYIGVDDGSSKGLYNCKNQLCLTSLDFSLVNNGLLEKSARYTNKDPNTTPQQILGSYGALLQLFAVQQKDRFVQKTLSSFAMFLQNPKNISIHIKANKPVNENVLLDMLLNDAKSLKRQNPIKNGANVDLENGSNIKLINNIQKIFNISFDVNK